MTSKKLCVFFALLTAITLSGCATLESGAGCNIPYPTNYKAKITTLMSKDLFDPYSAQFVMSTPSLARHKGKCVYFIDGTLNAKNRFGGYVGAQRFQATIDGQGNAKRINEFATSFLNALQ